MFDFQNLVVTVLSRPVLSDRKVVLVRRPTAGPKETPQKYFLSGDYLKYEGSVSLGDNCIITGREGW
jgi:hypothetical protein